MGDKTNDICPGCGHHGAHHYKDVGCISGWTWDKQGVVEKEGCLCEWSHISSPTSF